MFEESVSIGHILPMLIAKKLPMPINRYMSTSYPFIVVSFHCFFFRFCYRLHINHAVSFFLSFYSSQARWLVKVILSCVRFMISCDQCEDWFHGDCVGISLQQGRKMEENNEEYICPKCHKVSLCTFEISF